MSDTPETDAITSVGLENADRECVPAEFARKLERERDDAREKAERYRIEANAIMMQRDEAREAFKIVYNERVQMELERDEWKNKAYSHATDYTLMEAKCFRLEQQLKEYDQLKS